MNQHTDARIADPAAPAATLRRRLAAMGYDGLLLFSVLFVASAPALVLTRGEAVDAGNPLFGAYLGAIWVAYFGWQWTRGGQTLGMKAWRLRLVSADGAPVTWPRALARIAVAALSAAAFGAGYLWKLIDREGRTWHDIASGTRPILEPKPPVT